MSQNPIAVYPQFPGGLSRALNITAATIIKTTPGQVYRIFVTAPGTTGGALTINDNNALTGNTAANTILSIPFGSLSAGQVITLECPCASGIVISAVPTGGSPIYSITYS